MVLKMGPGVSMRRSPIFFRNKPRPLAGDIQIGKPWGCRRHGCGPGGMAKSQTPKTPTLTRAMRHIKWRMVADGHWGPTCQPACLRLLSVRVWNHASGGVQSV